MRRPECRRGSRFGLNVKKCYGLVTSGPFHRLRVCERKAIQIRRHASAGGNAGCGHGAAYFHIAEQFRAVVPSGDEHERADVVLGAPCLQHRPLETARIREEMRGDDSSDANLSFWRSRLPSSRKRITRSEEHTSEL